MHLRELRCESHGALVFVSFNDEVESLDRYLGGLVDMLADVPWDGVRLYKEVDFPIDCNWKCVHDAFSETYHVQFAHNNTVHQALNRTFTARQMLRHGHNAMIVRNRAAEAGAGPQNVLDAGPAAAAGSGIELNELTRAAQRSYNIFPNLTLPVGENLMTILQAIPVSADHTIFRLRYIKVNPAAAMDTEADRATVEDILRRAGIGTGSFYDYFPNKTAVALALLESVSTEIAGDARKYLSISGGSRSSRACPRSCGESFTATSVTRTSSSIWSTRCPNCAQRRKIIPSTG